MEFLLSCISTKHSMLKKHWSESKQQTECPLTVLGSREKPKDDQGGLLCLIDESGHVRNSVDLAMPAGMTPPMMGIWSPLFMMSTRSMPI